MVTAIASGILTSCLDMNESSPFWAFGLVESTWSGNVNFYRAKRLTRR